MNRTLNVILAACAAVAMSGCSTGQATDKPSPAPAAADPYTEYLRIAPTGAPALSREDAQTRALLGCGTEWAPGTVDAALRQAYSQLCPR